MATPVIVTGDDVSLSVTLKKDAATFTIDPGATVKASIVASNHSQSYISAVTQTEVAGSDWANSLVIVNFSAAVTGAITYQGPALLEIEVDDSGKTTWYDTITLVKGNI